MMVVIRGAWMSHSYEVRAGGTYDGVKKRAGIVGPEVPAQDFTPIH